MFRPQSAISGLNEGAESGKGQEGGTGKGRMCFNNDLQSFPVSFGRVEQCFRALRVEIGQLPHFPPWRTLPSAALP